MAPGDLNLKKSWYPKLMKNQAKVWQMEQNALQEHKLIQERQQEFLKERKKQELIDLQIKNNPSLRAKLEQQKKRIDWMYDDPGNKGGNDESFMDAKERDDILLGKKKIQKIVSRPQQETDSTAAKRNHRDRDRLSSVLSMTSPSTTSGVYKAAPRADLAALDPMARINSPSAAAIAKRKQQQEALLRDRRSRESSSVRSGFERSRTYNDRARAESGRSAMASSSSRKRDLSPRR